MIRWHVPFFLSTFRFYLSKYWYIFVILHFFGLHGLDKIIDNVTLRLWKFSGFCSRHTVGIAGDDTMYHILIVCVYFCHEICPDDLTMKDWCHTNNILLVHSWRCLVVQVMFHCTHGVIDNVARSQIKSNFEIAISPSIFELERRSKAQNIRTANGYLPDTFNFRYHFR